MKTPRMIANHEKAVVPRQGTAAFSISTQFHQLPNRMAFPAISHGRGEKCSTIDNLLPKAHYFRRGLAKHPLPLVIRIEGKIKPFSGREVLP